MGSPPKPRQLFLHFGDSTECCGGGCEKEEEAQKAPDQTQVKQSYAKACEELLEEDE
jgi:hypothetical protein